MQKCLSSYTETLNIAYIITEQLCVVSGRESVHPESRGQSLLVFRIIILFIFCAFRLKKDIVHIAGMWQEFKKKVKKTRIACEQIFNLWKRQLVTYLASSSERRWDSSTTWRWRCVISKTEKTFLPNLHLHSLFSVVQYIYIYSYVQSSWQIIH